MNNINNLTDLAGNLAANAQSLDSLRAQAKHSPDQALKSVAQQFEAVFMNMMMKSMREATPQEGMLDSEQTQMFTSMLDQQLVQNISKRGVGLAEIMVRQLSQTNGALSTASLPPPISARDMTSLPAGVSNSTQGVTTQQQFTQRFAQYAEQASLATGISASVILAQAALESGWGKREIKMPDGSSSHNLFGIKANKNWQGEVAEVMTTEYKNGQPEKVLQPFRAYASYTEAFADYASFLRDNPRYEQATQAGLGAVNVAHALQRAGYATDPKYADKLVQIMNRIDMVG